MRKIQITLRDCFYGIWLVALTLVIAYQAYTIEQHNGDIYMQKQNVIRCEATNHILGVTIRGRMQRIETDMHEVRYVISREVPRTARVDQ